MSADVPAHSGTLWNDIPPLTFTLTADEAAVESKPRPLTGVTRLIWGISAALNVFTALQRIIHHRGDAITVAVGIAAAVVAAALALGLEDVLRPRQPRPGDYALRFTVDAIVVEQPKPAVIAWRRVTQVQDLGEAFLITSRSHAPLFLPKRVFDDRGATLWARLEQQLIGGYQLRRRPGSSLIVNTARA